MIFSHIGIAVSNIDKAIASLKKSFPNIRLLSEIVFDPNQKVRLLLLECGEVTLELVEGEKVEGMLEKGQTYYHVCYKVSDVEKTLQEIKGVIQVVPPYPAPLFDGRRVAFVYHRFFGLIEFLEESL